MLGTILLIILILVLVGGISPFGARGGTPFYGVGYGWGGGGLGIILIIVVVLLVSGRL